MVVAHPLGCRLAERADLLVAVPRPGVLAARDAARRLAVSDTGEQARGQRCLAAVVATIAITIGPTTTTTAATIITTALAAILTTTVTPLGRGLTGWFAGRWSTRGRLTTCFAALTRLTSCSLATTWSIPPPSSVAIRALGPTLGLGVARSVRHRASICAASLCVQ
jgi:MFS family permease